MWKKALFTLANLTVGIVFISSAWAAYPTRAIEIVCLYTGGGATDILARGIADIATKRLGQPVVVVNKPGAAGTIAAADVINSKPDGYKIAILSNLYFATTVKTQKIPFDPNILVPLGSFLEYKIGFGVRADAPWKTLNELPDYGRKNPDKIKWAHPGRGTMPHMQALLLLKKANVRTLDVPQKGLPEAVSAILGGHVDAVSFSYSNFIDHIKTGKVRYLVFFSDQRFSRQPDVPCSAELGFPEPAKLVTSWALWVHKDTPEDVKKILIDTCKWTYEQPEFKQLADNLGEEAKYGGPEYVREMVRRGEETGVPILKELGLYVEK